MISTMDQTLTTRHEGCNEASPVRHPTPSPSGAITAVECQCSGACEGGKAPRHARVPARTQCLYLYYFARGGIFVPMSSTLRLQICTNPLPPFLICAFSHDLAFKQPSGEHMALTAMPIINVTSTDSILRGQTWMKHHAKHPRSCFGVNRFTCDTLPRRRSEVLAAIMSFVLPPKCSSIEPPGTFFPFLIRQSYEH